MSQCSHQTEGIGNTILYCIKSKGHALPHEYYAPPLAATDPEAREAMRAQIVETLGEHTEVRSVPLPRNNADRSLNRTRYEMQCTCGAEMPWGCTDEQHEAHLADVLLGLWDGDES